MVKFLGSQKLYVDFQLHGGGSVPLTVQESTRCIYNYITVTI